MIARKAELTDSAAWEDPSNVGVEQHHQATGIDAIRESIRLHLGVIESEFRRHVVIRVGIRFIRWDVAHNPSVRDGSQAWAMMMRTAS